MPSAVERLKNENLLHIQNKQVVDDFSQRGFHEAVRVEFKSQWVEECLEREDMDPTNVDNPFTKFGYKRGENAKNR